MVESFGRYELVRRLAVGGMAEVFLARVSGPVGFSKLVALKRILPHLGEDQTFVQMFLDEARLAARFNHPNIVQIFDLGLVDDSYFVAMEYVPGASVAQLLSLAVKRQVLMPIDHAVKIVLQACEALEYVHTFTDPNGQHLNLIHRDISPQNLLVSYDGIVKLLDFGIAKAASNHHSTAGDVLKGKLGYLAPEQITRAVALDQRGDIFGLGVVLYELLSAKRAFTGGNELELMAKVVNGPMPDLRQVMPEIPDTLADIASKAMATNREQRYASARQLRADLEAFAVAREFRLDNYHLARYVRESIPPPEMEVGYSSPTPTLPRTPLPAALTRDTVDSGKRIVGKDSRRVWSYVMVAMAVIAALGWTAWRTKLAPGEVAAPVAVVMPQQTELPQTEKPQTESSRTEQPQTEKPKTEQPRTEEPKTEQPQTEEPKTEKPKAEQPHPPTAQHHPAKSHHPKDHHPSSHPPPATTSLTPATSPNPPEKGQLEVLVMPYGNVFIDGKAAGMTPLDAPLTLLEGTHSVKVVNDELGKNQTRSVHVDPNTTTRVKFDLR